MMTFYRDGIAVDESVRRVCSNIRAPELTPLGTVLGCY